MCLFGLYSFFHQSCTPVHSFFESEPILENPLQIFTNLFFNAYITRLRIRKKGQADMVNPFVYLFR